MNRGAWIRVAVVAIVLVGVLLCWQAGLFDLLDRETLRRWAQAAGGFGPLLFVALFAVGELLHVPSVIFVVVAGLIWPLPVAFATAYGGSLVAAATVFVVARLVLRGALGDTIRSRLPAAVRRYDEKLATQGIRTVALIRVLTFMSPLMHWVLAGSQVRFREMMIGSAIGLLPGITALVIGGDQAVAHWTLIKPYLLAAIALLVLFRVVQTWHKRGHGKGVQPALEPPRSAEPPPADPAAATTEL